VTEKDKAMSFDELVQQALRRMQEASRSSVSSSYEVHRSNGEVVVRRSDSEAPALPVVEAPLKKTGTG
jgi:hypothetical protein